jgi:hypothetical protein
VGSALGAALGKPTPRTSRGEPGTFELKLNAEGRIDLPPISPRSQRAISVFRDMLKRPLHYRMLGKRMVAKHIIKACVCLAMSVCLHIRQSRNTVAPDGVVKDSDALSDFPDGPTEPTCLN